MIDPDSDSGLLLGKIHAMAMKSEVIQHFLLTNAPPDLATRYHIGMECQVNVAQDNGHPIQGEFHGKKWRGWTDDNQTWKSFRIPFNAAKNAEYTDSELKFDFRSHVEAIGMTGWNWKERCSHWFAFDFDAVTGHADAHTRKLEDGDLALIVESVKAIPWVQLRKSTSGKGLHMYVYVDSVPTDNHHEHAAVARAILAKLSVLVNFDFNAKVDICGGNMWVWHRKMRNTDGLSIIKQHTELLVDIPTTWRDHIKVVKGQKKRVSPEFIEQTGVDEFDQLCGQYPKIALDEEHKKLIEWLKGKPDAVWWWDSERHMLVTHTLQLAEAAKELVFKGIFATASKGSTPHNCFMFPIPKGGWAVRRFGKGCSEHPSWDQDTQGWTRCFLNKDVDLPTAAKTFGGIELPGSGGYQFQEAEMAVKVATQLGTDIKIPPNIALRQATLKEQKDGKIVFEVHKDPNDPPATMQGWATKGNKWIRVYAMPKHTRELETPISDDLIRHTVNETERASIGWYVNAEGHWQREPLEHVRALLSNEGHAPNMIQPIVGQCVKRSWREVNIPFGDEYPGNRDWNRRGARLSVIPNPDRDNLKYPTWQKILKHLGANLDSALPDNAWAVENSILTGADYLKCWMASLFQMPFAQLPYLFFFGDQDCGKSVFYESMQLLFERGHVQANNALLSSSNFNGELANAVLCVIEEIDLSKAKYAYNRVKDYVTGINIQIHEKGKTPYTLRNSTHWVQVANSHTFCPAFTGDTRITVIHVSDLDPLELIPKTKLLQLLKEEAPDFLASLLDLELPAPVSRLNIPVITTTDKMSIAANNMNPVQQFLAEKTHYAPGHTITLGELYSKFTEWLPTESRIDWGKVKFAREIPTKFPKGPYINNVVTVGNISFDKVEPSNFKTPFILNDVGFLRAKKC